MPGPTEAISGFGGLALRIWGLAFVEQCIFHVTVDVNLGEQKLSSQ